MTVIHDHGGASRPAPDAGAGTGAGSGTGTGPEPTPAPVPKRPAPIGWVGMTVALLLTALGVLALFDGVVRAGWVDDAEPVLTPFLTGPAEVTPQPGAAVVGGLLALLGLWLLVTALRPGRRAGVSLGGPAGLWISHGDLEKLAAGTAERCDGVLGAHARSGRRTLTVDVETTTSDVEDATEVAVRERLSGFADAPRVVVRTTPRFERTGR